MAKERKCRKCGLTYKGMKTSCPYCHRTTKYGTLNKIMAFIGYLTTAVTVLSLAYFGLIASLETTVFLIPTVIFIAIVVAIIILIIK